MKATDLMLGDWVVDGGENARVTSLTCDGIIETTRRISNVELVEPIPLTSEILEENGFIRFGTDYILEGRHFGLENPSTASNYLNNYWLRVSIKAVRIKFVHELQHALRLCGIEKEIKL